jgi:penicillin-binding protein 1C
MNLLKRIFIFLFLLIILIVILNYLYPLDIHRLNKPKSTQIYDRNGKILAIKLSRDGYLRIPIRKDEITPNIKKILLGYEDRYFYKHFGVNPLSIIRAIYLNMINQHKIGASTITMQVARMMHHKPRTLKQKFIEMFQAFQIEWYYSKDEILTLYLNNAPYGGNIEGFSSASFKYFHIPPSSLSLAQIAYLCSIPKNPNKNRPKRGTNINKIKNSLLKRLFELDILTQKEYREAIDENISIDIKSLPNKAPHISAKIRDENIVKTTIDLVLQQKVQNIIKEKCKKLEKYGIHNGSAIVIDNKSMQILAYIGSQDFYDNKYGGQNDGLSALISPGSTLKPFVYAKALEKGLITPLKKLYDVPIFINGYKPTNYSKHYLGEVTAKEALEYSLNVPAVELDRLLGRDSLYSLLKKCKINSLDKSKWYYGSALVLGGWGLSLKKDAELFASLANSGVYQPSIYLYKNQNREKKRILSKESTYLISNILADAPRVEFSSYWEFIKNMPKIAFKTGTSSHNKDMLTIGYTPQYTVGVWFGNFSPRYRVKKRHSTGLYIASPVLFDIFNILDNDNSWFKKPKNIIKKEICQDAIKIGECRNKIIDDTIKRVELKTPCNAMRAEVLSYLLENGDIDSIKSLSTHRCYKKWKNYKPLITSPIHNKTYIFNKLLPKELKKTALECYSFEENQTIYWLIDNKPPIISKSGEKIYIYLSPKSHTISCLDEGAKIQSITIFNQEL